MSTVMGQPGQAGPVAFGYKIRPSGWWYLLAGLFLVAGIATGTGVMGRFVGKIMELSAGPAFEGRDILRLTSRMIVGLGLAFLGLVAALVVFLVTLLKRIASRRTIRQMTQPPPIAD